MAQSDLNLRTLLTECDPPHCRTCWDFDPRCTSDHQSEADTHVRAQDRTKVFIKLRKEVFIQTSNLGCRWCRFVCESDAATSKWLETSGECVRLLLTYGEPARLDTLGSGRVDIYRCGQYKNVFRALGSLPCIPDAGGSGQSLRFLKDNFEKCCRHHSKCQPANQLLPGRLLKLDSDKTLCCLIEPSGRALLQYAALSYCWGGEQSFKLTSITLEQMKNRIEVGTLPRTHQDAILVCHWLGLEYLWIDALTIIQDDADDWEKEAAKMADVYENAAIVISASSVSSCHESFLNSRAYSEDEKSIDLWNDEINPSSSIKARRRTLHGYYRLREENGGLDPAEKRGWTLQEINLARRCMVFTSREVVWYCREMRACECGDNGSLNSMTGPALYHQLLKGKKERIPTFWSCIIREYRLRRLSSWHDTLPALAGLAKRIHDMTGMTYIAGLWQELLPHNLLWISTKQHCDCLCLGYYAPSFSWASVVGGVETTSFASVVSTLKILDVHTVLENSFNPFGKVRGGYIELNGPIFKALMSWSQEYGLYIDVSDMKLSLPRASQQSLSFYPDTVLATSNTSSGTGEWIHYAQRRRSDNPQCNLLAAVKCLRVAHSKPDSAEYQEYVLVLGPSSFVSGAWERLGLATYDASMGGFQSFRDWLEGLPKEQLLLV